MPTKKEEKNTHERIIKDLVDILLKVKDQSSTERVVPFIGAGITSVVDETINTRKLIKHLKDENSIPEWVEFKLDKTSQYSDIMPEGIFKSRNIVANYIKKRQDEHLEAMRKEKDRGEYFFMPKKNGKKDSMRNPLWALANLPIPIYITTNYDTLLEEYLIDAKKTPCTIVSNWMGWFGYDRETADAKIKDLKNKAVDKHNNENLKAEEKNLKLIKFNYQAGYYTVDNPLVFHLHGVIDLPATMVLTEDNYIDFLVSLNGKDGLSGDIKKIPVLPSEIANIFSAKHLLFLGYSLNDINLNVLLRSLRKSYTKDSNTELGSPFAVQRMPENPTIVQWILEEKIESSQTLSTSKLEVNRRKFVNWVNVNKAKNKTITGEEIWKKINQLFELPDLTEKTMDSHKKNVHDFIQSAFIQQADLKIKVIWSDLIIFLSELYEAYLNRSRKP